MTIFDNAPAVIYDYSYLFNPQKYKLWLLDKMKKEHILLRTLIDYCITENDFVFETDLYPIYVILNVFIDVYSLSFCEVKYVGNTYSKTP